MHLSLSVVALGPIHRAQILQVSARDTINTQQFRKEVLEQPNSWLLITSPPLPLADERFNRNPWGYVRGWYDRGKWTNRIVSMYSFEGI